MLEKEIYSIKSSTNIPTDFKATFNKQNNNELLQKCGSSTVGVVCILNEECMSEKKPKKLEAAKCRSNSVCLVLVFK